MGTKCAGSHGYRITGGTRENNIIQVHYSITIVNQKHIAPPHFGLP
ncbi:hypothetical protein ES703_122815 [subsurface metagenome]